MLIWLLLISSNVIVAADRLEAEVYQESWLSSLVTSFSEWLRLVTSRTTVIADDSKAQSCQKDEQSALIKGFVKQHKQHPPNGYKLLTVGRSSHGLYMVAFLRKHQLKIADDDSTNVKVKIGSLTDLKDIPVFKVKKKLNYPEYFIVKAELLIQECLHRFEYTYAVTEEEALLTELTEPMTGELEVLEFLYKHD